MSRFVRIASGADVLGLQLELGRAAHLWDTDPRRRLYPGTPHAQMVDITVRYMDVDQLVDLEARKRQHRNVFWSAWHALPSLRPMVFALMTRVQAVELGSILITKLPPGGEILPHSDAGSWAPEYYNCKAHIIVSGRSVTRCDGEECEQRAGDIWTFDNLQVHSIWNSGDVDRICCIVSMRAE